MQFHQDYEDLAELEEARLVYELTHLLMFLDTEMVPFGVLLKHIFAT